MSPLSEDKLVSFLAEIQSDIRQIKSDLPRRLTNRAKIFLEKNFLERDSQMRRQGRKSTAGTGSIEGMPPAVISAHFTDNILRVGLNYQFH